MAFLKLTTLKASASSSGLKVFRTFWSTFTKNECRASEVPLIVLPACASLLEKELRAHMTLSKATEKYPGTLTAAFFKPAMCSARGTNSLIAMTYLGLAGSSAGAADVAGPALLAFACLRAFPFGLAEGFADDVEVAGPPTGALYPAALAVVANHDATTLMSCLYC
jgi:hypothetical protein